MKPFVAVVFGLMGSGKSRRAKALAEATKANYISSDIIRKLMAKIPLTQRAERHFGKGIYSKQFTEKVYQEMLNQAYASLEAGTPAVLDATYSKRSHRDQVREAAAQWNAPLFFFFVDTSEEVIRQRLLRRERKKVISDGRLDVFPQHKESFQPPQEDENIIRISGEEGVDRAVGEMVAIIKGALEGP